MSERIVEVRAGTPGSLGRAWRDVYITAEVERSKGKRPNKGKVELYNLSAESLRFLEQSTAVQVLAGVSPGERVVVKGALLIDGVAEQLL